MAAGKLDPPSWCNVSVEELQLAKEAFKTGGKDGILTFFKHKLDEWKNVDINIAIIGDAGQGKSTFINTIRGLRADDDGAARVDVTQTTCELWPYLHPNNEQLTFWDLPGLNTPDYTRDNYFEMISFQAFDFYLLVSATRLKDDDKWLAGEIEKRGRKFFFIRPKVHIDIQNDRYDHPRSKDDPNQPTDVLQRIMGEIEGRLAPLHAERGRNVFLVDSQHPRHYDFPTLQRRLIEQLPTEIKRETLLRSIAAYDRQLLDDKKEVLKKDVSRAAFISGLVALAPVPGVSVAMDLSLVAGISKQWYKTFGIDRESLQKTAMDTGTDISELQKIVDDENTSAFLTKEAILNFLLKCGSAIGIAMAGEEASRLVLPVLGSIIACPLSAYSTHKMLMYILEKMHGTAVKVVEFANKNITA